MNIFFTSFDPVECARYLDDKRCIKMSTETAQMLSTALAAVGGTEKYEAYSIKTKKKTYAYYISGTNDKVYVPTHANHPSNVWARKTKQNYLWLCHHGIALCKEYTRRYGKRHSAQDLIEKLMTQADRFPSTGLTTLPNCAANQTKGIDYKSEVDIYKAYRLYLNDRWATDVHPAKCKVPL